MTAKARDVLMPCSPLLQGLSEPLQVLRVLSQHYLLQYSEPPHTFKPLKKNGWVIYESGCWRITDEGYKVLDSSPTAEEPQSLTEFFGL